MSSDPSWIGDCDTCRSDPKGESKELDWLAPDTLLSWLVVIGGEGALGACGCLNGNVRMVWGVESLLPSLSKLRAETEAVMFVSMTDVRFDGVALVAEPVVPVRRRGVCVTEAPGRVVMEGDGGVCRVIEAKVE